MAKRKYHLEHRDFIQELYLTPNESGGHRYVLREMAEKFEKRYKYKIHLSLIANWSKKNQWDVLFQQARNLGTGKALSPAETREENLKAVVSDEIAERRKTAAQKKKMADYLIMKALSDEVERVKGGGKADEGPFDLRTLQNIAKIEHDIINGLDGSTGPKTTEDKLDEIMTRFDEIQ